MTRLAASHSSAKVTKMGGQAIQFGAHCFAARA